VPFGSIGDRPLVVPLVCGSTDSFIFQSIAVFRPSTLFWEPWCEGGAMNPFGLPFQYGESTDVPLVK
jgi:hypothetical protein